MDKQTNRGTAKIDKHMVKAMDRLWTDKWTNGWIDRCTEG